MQAEEQRKTTGDPLGVVLSHRVRAQSMTILADRMASATEIARQIGHDVSGVSYHLSTLRDLGLIEEVDNRRVRGSVERYYRAITRPCISDEEEARMTDAERSVFANVILSVFAADARTALDSATFVKRPDHHATRVPLRVDEQGWSELAEAYMDLFERVYEIQTGSAKRLGTTDDPGIPVISFLALFEMPERLPSQTRRTPRGDKRP